MISRVAGTLLAHQGDKVEVMTAAGIGYEMSVPASTWGDVPRVGAPVELRTVQVVREDSITLYGFATDAERNVFQRLLGASGIGPKTALAMLSTLGAGGVASAVQAKDIKALSSVPGIGKKSAERIALELSGKLDDVTTSDGPNTSDNLGIAIEALVALGFTRDGAAAAARKAREAEPDIDSEGLVRIALRQAA